MNDWFDKQEDFMQNKPSGGAFFGIKTLIIAGISLALLIPAAMLSSIVRERQRLSTDVKEEIIQGAAGELRMAGPFIIVPVEHKYISDEIHDGIIQKRETILRKEIVIFPRELTINGTAKTEERARGIYTAAVFTGSFNFKAAFDIQEEKIAALFTYGELSILLENSRLCFGISDPRSLRETPVITMPDGDILELTSDFISLGITDATLAGKMAVKPGQLELDFTMETGGGGSISIIPIGLGTNVRLSADWPTPSFTGGNAPIVREIHDNGFTADWKQPRGTGTSPEYFLLESQKKTNYNKSGMTVEFFDSVGVYHKTERALKYALLFIVVPFIVILLFEVFTKKRIHPIQYALVGIADVIFYALLLSLAEQMHFTAAYFIAAGSVILVISFYTGSILKNFRRGCVLVPILALLYGYLYSALQSQDYALLIGSVGMFVILIVVMVITRNIDWYAIGSTLGDTLGDTLGSRINKDESALQQESPPSGEKQEPGKNIFT